MKSSIRTVVSLNKQTIIDVNNIVNKLKTLTTAKVNFSMVVRTAIIYLASLDSELLDSLLIQNKANVKWQTDQSLIQEKNITLDQHDCMMI